jgi:transcriptional regulator with XRE-family HTH domain
MEEKNTEIQKEFLTRTTCLARWLHVELEEVANLLGVSRATLFRYRSGRYPIPRSVIRMLTTAEINAGMQSVQIETKLLDVKNDAEREKIIREASLPERLAAYPAGSYEWSMNLQGAILELEIMLSSYTENTRELCRLSRLAGEEKPTDKIQALSKKVAWISRKIEPKLQEFFTALMLMAEKAEREAENKESHGAP